MKYRVLRGGLEYPTDPAVVERLLAGENIPYGERGMVRREEGAVVDDVPACSVPWLVEQGYIEPVGAGG